MKFVSYFFHAWCFVYVNYHLCSSVVFPIGCLNTTICVEVGVAYVIFCAYHVAVMMSASCDLSICIAGASTGNDMPCSASYFSPHSVSLKNGCLTYEAYCWCSLCRIC